ncbi:MAG: lysine 2,3-aminomutase [Kofleriaceae bacterium]|nr:lysine 2,3-aminomutase [Kofleriaceae bacterium]MCL4226844.1 lysine 2,3-aminomutase [Myxococcales bacterium]
MTTRDPAPTRFRAIDPTDASRVPQLAALSAATRAAMRRVAHVLPFRVNPYVVEHLIDWSRVPDDPIFQLTFPQPDMLAPADHARLQALEAAGPGDALVAAAREIQHRLNPHPAGQVEHNVPRLRGRPLPGIQHKYRETVLFFPSQGQTCHAYCSYCFRWPQFVGLDELKFASREVDDLIGYLREHPEVTSVLITGGDPMIMRSALLRRYVEPLLAADLPQLASIRIGTKSVAYWPHRFVSDDDADDVLALFEQVAATGKSLALMAHYSHPRELATEVARRALARIRATGAVVRCQAPLIRHVNDDAASWAELWRTQVQLGAIPYYMFIARDTGARQYFEVPLARAWRIYRDALAAVSGLARTVRGPSMSATPGKVVVDGVTTVAGKKVFALRLLQARDPAWVGRPFFAEYDAAVSWLDGLRPAFGEPHFFFEPELAERLRQPLRVVQGAA